MEVTQSAIEFQLFSRTMLHEHILKRSHDNSVKTKLVIHGIKGMRDMLQGYCIWCVKVVI